MAVGIDPLTGQIDAPTSTGGAIAGDTGFFSGLLSGIKNVASAIWDVGARPAADVASAWAQAKISSEYSKPLDNQSLAANSPHLQLPPDQRKNWTLATQPASGMPSFFSTAGGLSPTLLLVAAGAAALFLLKK